MFIVALIAAAATLTWLAIAAPHLRLWAMAIAAIVIAYPLGHTFWHLEAGPLPLTIDRVFLIGVVALLVYRWRAASFGGQPFLLVDYCLVGWLVWLTLSALVALPVDPTVLPTSPLGRLAFSFWVPALLYVAARQSELSPRVIQYSCLALTLLGTYLAITAVAESTGQWWAVFPRYIADPNLGLHFGRARGPALNSVCLGIYLSVCLWGAWTLIHSSPRWGQLVLLTTMSLMAVAVVLTQTRSVWLGLAASSLWMLSAYLPTQIRKPVTVAAIVVALAVGLVAKSNLVSMERENSVGDAAHSVEQRAAFAYVSWHMVQDNPLWGVGFGRFYDRKLPYLADRRQSFELESIRDLHHHNTFLSFLTETGMVGFVGFLAVLGGWSCIAWRLSFDESRPTIYRFWGRLAIATLLIYVSSAMFHDVTLLPQDQWLLYFVVGVATALAYMPTSSTLKVATAHDSPARFWNTAQA